MTDLNIDIKNQSDFIYDKEGKYIQISPLALSILDEMIKDRRQNLDRPLKYLEFGSGVSTAYFAEKYPEMEIYSVEGDKEWFELVKTWVNPKKYEYHKATNYYVTDPDCNREYITCMENDGPFDFILNDGAQREMVADYIFQYPEKFIAKGGFYFRHDYEKYIIGDWVGYHLDNQAQTAEEFAARNPEYSLITINGNGKWGYKCELGGLWYR